MWFINIPWTDAPGGQFDPDAIVPLLDIARRDVWWKIKGSAATALVGIVSCGGVERYFDLSRDKMKATEQAAIARQTELLALEKSETDQSKRDALTVSIAIITCVAGVGGGIAIRNPGVVMAGAASCYAAYDKAVGDAAAARKAAEERNEIGRAGPARGHGGAAVGGAIGGGQRPHRGL